MLPLLVALALGADPAPPETVDVAAGRLLDRATRGEPAIAEVQRAAARAAPTAEVSGWRARPRLAALLPQLTAHARVDERRYRTVGLTTTSEVDYVRDNPGTTAGLRLSWDLGSVVWSDAELRAAQHAGAAAKAREDAVQRATRLYFERQRLLVLVASQPAVPLGERADQELRLEELAAELDALTGGLYARARP
jgi:hypothetical protein